MIRELEVAIQQHKKLPNRKTNSFHAREPSAMATSPMKKRISPKVCYSPGRCFGLFLGRSRNTYYGERENYVPVRACTSLSPKKGKKGLKILVYSHQFF